MQNRRNGRPNLGEHEKRASCAPCANYLNVRRLADTVQETFKTGDQIARVELLDPSTDEVVGRFYYTPVKQIEKHRTRLDALLHHQKRFRKQKDKWWSEQRAWLREVEHD